MTGKIIWLDAHSTLTSVNHLVTYSFIRREPKAEHRMVIIISKTPNWYQVSTFTLLKNTSSRKLSIPCTVHKSKHKCHHDIYKQFKGQGRT
jgi:hypothetical protein